MRLKRQLKVHGRGERRCLAWRPLPAFRFLSLDPHPLDQFAALTVIRDPFDRLIVSAARCAQAALIARDARLADCGLVETIWARSGGGG